MRERLQTTSDEALCSSRTTFKALRVFLDEKLPLDFFVPLEQSFMNDGENNWKF